MKKLFFSCVLLLFLIPICSYAKVNVTGVPLGDSRVWNQLSIEHKNSQSVQYLKKIVLLPRNSYNKYDATTMVERLMEVDNSLLLALSEREVKMKLFSGKLTDERAFRHLQGIKPKGWSNGKTWDDVPGAGGTFIAAAKIGSSDPGEDHGSVNLELHEIAHSIDTIVLQHASRNQEFKVIWKKEAKILFPTNEYFTEYPEEYFAEAFAMYYLNEKTRQKLKKSAPKTFEYMKELHKRKKRKEVIPYI